MAGDMVIVKAELIEKYRRENALNKVELAAKFSIHGATSSNALAGEPVNLSIAKKIAKAMGIPAQDLIEKWVEGDGDNNKDTDNDGQQQ